MELLDAIEGEVTSAFAHAEFAEVASYTPAGGAARDVRGIFDRVSEVQDVGELLQHDGVAATFVVATADVPEVSLSGDRVLVRGYDYGVHGIEPDGTGMTRLVLSI